MDKIDFNSNLKTLEEIILDEQRLVTYLSLSKELCIHVNEAKLLLNKAVEDIRTKQPYIDLNVNYIVSGLIDAHKGQTTVCSETELDDIKKSFETLFFQHVYSLSKGSSSVNKEGLIATNKLDDLPLCIGLIKSQSCSKRTIDEIGSLKSDSQATDNNLNTNKSLQNNTRTSKANKIVPKEEKINGHQDDNSIKSYSEVIVKTELSSPKKISSVNKPLSKNGGKVSKSIAGFFNKANSVTKTNEKRDNKHFVTEKPIKKVKEEKMEVDNPIIEHENKQTIQSQTKPEKKEVSNIKKGAKVDKKRKRVLHISDSESDNEMNDTTENIQSEDEIPPTPDNITVKIMSGIVNPKKRRKIIDKTYVDDEGYILTRKEEVYESCSENETHKKENLGNIKIPIKTEISPKDNKLKRKKKSISPQKEKQQSIMNFFKKI